MSYCLIYWIISPPSSIVRDDPSRSASFSIPFCIDGGVVFEVSLYCREDRTPEFLRCRVDRLHENTLSPVQEAAVYNVREHMLSVMRLTYGTDIALIDPETMRVFFDDGEPYTFEVSLQYIKCIPEEAAANTVALFNSTYPGLQQIIRLYVDGSNRAFPVGYRYLSNYKILELTFRHRTHWNKNNLKELLSLFEDEFRANGFRKEICGTLHALRDKCVHPKNIHGASEVIGFTSLDLDKIVEIEKFLPVLRKACAEVINRRSNGAFHVTPTEIGS